MNTSNKGKVIVGMSGGVDSSVTAHLLLQQGYQVEGLFMKNWQESDAEVYCTAAEDFKDAEDVANLLGIKLHSINFAAEYWDRVFAHFLDEYRAGRTPNPDVLCNREIKFKAFLDYALALGAEHIATGHYAKVIKENNHFHMRLSSDEGKDQTYFLYMLGQKALSHTLFPLGDLTKDEVREIATQQKLPNHKKKDSTGICFIGERKFRDFLSQYLPANPGDIETTDGEYLGEHQGLMYYTLGQRQGLGIGGKQGSEEKPWFVAKKDLRRNRLIVVQGHDHPLLFSDALNCSQLHWVTGNPPTLPLSCHCRIRHRQALQACTIEPAEDGLLHITFPQPQRAVTPGQSIVFYLDDDCLGGGIIETN
jgi:tRNA-specific 2-thiouridylase